jgi:transposase
VELYARVRRAVVVHKMSEREAAKQFGLARETVRKMLGYSVPPGYRRQQIAKKDLHLHARRRFVIVIENHAG